MLGLPNAPDAPHTPYTRRVAITQATVNKYNGRTLEWGKCDCIRPVAAQLRAFGYKVSLAKYGSYSSLTGALRALKNSGFTTLEEALEAHGVKRQGYASALPGDIMALPGEGSSWVALVVYLGNGRVLGFGDSPDGEICGVMQPLEVVASWRLEWQKP
jgi:hypothetical protein